MNLIIRSIDAGRVSFQNSLRKLPENIRSEARQALKDLIKHPQPGYLKLEKLSGYKRPDIYTIHFTGNNSHKMSFELDGDKALLRKVGTHKKIDRAP